MISLEVWWKGKVARFVAALGASAYFLYYASTASDWHFIDNIDLIIHEAGHWVFLPFGEFMHVLGGSLFQSIFPLLYVGYFYFKRDYYSGSLLLFWSGANLVNVSVYAADAQLMQLPLLGGDSVIHDWNWLLVNTRTIEYTPQIASCIYGLGLTIIIVAALLSIYWSQSEKPATQVSF
jgi:hypothetical protein